MNGTTTPGKIEHEIQLLVEGRDPEGFCEELIKHLTLKNVQIQNFGGVNQLRTFLPAFTKMSGFSGVTKVGIVRDAEENATDAFKSVQGCLERAGLSIPNKPEQPFGSQPEIAVMILPGGNRSGMLETLLCETFGEEDVHSCIDGFFECVEALQIDVHRPDKARVRAYLATKPEPNVSTGVAAKRRYWDFNHRALQPFCTFLKALATP